MGITYKALDVDLRCPVTLKVISERYLGDESTQLRFLREARAAASARHPKIASVFHLGRTGENYFYANGVLEGQTVAGPPLWPANWVSRTQPSSTAGRARLSVRPQHSTHVARVGIRLSRSDAQQ
jgi:serine/threonine protein kinase